MNQHMQGSQPPNNPNQSIDLENSYRIDNDDSMDTKRFIKQGELMNDRFGYEQ